MIAFLVIAERCSSPKSLMNMVPPKNFSPLGFFVCFFVFYNHFVWTVLLLSIDSEISGGVKTVHVP